MIEKFLHQYTHFIWDTWNQDKLLKMLQYSLWMLSRFYVTSSHAQEAMAHLSYEVGWARYVTRLLHLPTAFHEMTSYDWSTSDYDCLFYQFMACSMVFYYPLEALAYFKWKTPMWVAPTEERLAEQAFGWSMRVWLTYIVMDVLRSITTIHSFQKNKQGEKSHAATIKARRAECSNLVRNALLLPPAIHWSLPHWDTQPLLSETTYQMLMWLEAVVCLVQATIDLPPLDA